MSKVMGRLGMVGTLAAAMLAQQKPASAYTMGYAYTPTEIQAWLGANVVPTGCTQDPAYRCVVDSMVWSYSPGYVTNAAKGDAFLGSGPGITASFQVGFFFTHIGLVKDSFTVRQNTADMLKVTMDNVNIWFFGNSVWQNIGGVIHALLSGFYGSVTINGGLLYNMTPGLITTGLDGANGFTAWENFSPNGGQNINNYNVIYANPSTQAWRAWNWLLKPTTTLRPDAQKAVDWMMTATRTYRFHGFYKQPPGEATAVKGNVCSGTVAVANNSVTRTYAAAVPMPLVGQARTGVASLNLGAWAYQTIRWDLVSKNAPAILGTGARDDVARGLRDQLMTCLMGSTTCNDYNGNWYPMAQKSAGIVTTGTGLADGQGVGPDAFAFAGAATKSVPGCANVPRDPATGKYLFDTSSNVNNAYLGGSQTTCSNNTVTNSRWGNLVNGGAWQNSTIVTPTYSGGAWYPQYYGHSVVNTGGSG